MDAGCWVKDHFSDKVFLYRVKGVWWDYSVEVIFLRIFLFTLCAQNDNLFTHDSDLFALDNKITSY